MSLIKKNILWYRMKSVALKHPFFRRKDGLLKRSEARKIIKACNVLDGAEVIRQAKAELGINSVPYIYGTKKYIHRTQILATAKKKLAYIIIIMMTIGFLTLTDTGIAFAQNIYKIVISVVEGALLSKNTAPKEDVSFSLENVPDEFETLAAVGRFINYPIVVPGNEDDKLVSFSTQLIGEEILIVRSNYIRLDRRQYVIVQSMYSTESLWGGYYSVKEDGTTRIEAGIGLDAYISTMDDGTVYAELYGVGYDINISSIELSVDSIRDIVLNLNILS